MSALFTVEPLEDNEVEMKATESHAESSQVTDASELEGKTTSVEREKGLHVSSAPPPAVTNGGWVAWGTVLGAWLMQFTTFGYSNSFGVYQDFYTTTFLDESSPSRIGWIGSTQLCILLLCGFFVGRWQDQGYFYPIAITGTVLLSFSLFMLSLAHQNTYYQVFLSQALGMGIGSGFLYVPSLAILAHHFSGPKRAAVMMIVASGSSFGGIIHPIMLNNLFESVGFQNGVRASAGLCTGLNVIACSLTRTRLPPKDVTPLRLLMATFSKDGPYLLTVFGMSCNIIGTFFPIFYLQLFATQHGLSDNFVFYTLTILNSASFLGRLAPALLPGNTKRTWIFLLCAYGCTILVFAMTGLSNAPGIAVYTALFGLFSGTYITLLSPLFADFSRNVDEIGSRIGWAYGVASLAILIGNPIQGALLTSEFIWWRPALFSGLLMVVGSSSLTFSTFLLARRKKHAEK